MKSLQDFLTEGKVPEYKISYSQKFDDEGTSFRQSIRATLSEKELTEFNNRMKDLARSRVRYDGIYKELHEGENYTSLSTCREFCNFFGIAKDKRLRDENTVIIINVI